MGHFKLRFLYSLLVILGCTGMGIGQEVNSVKRIKAVQSFIKAEEVHIQQDFGDNLWITTPVKVMAYNSIEVKDYNKFRGVPKEIGTEFIETYTDSENKIWLSGNQGLAVFNAHKNEFQFVSNITGRIYAMLEDPAKQLWLAAENGIFKLNVDSDKKDFGISRFLSENTMASDIVLFNNNIVFAGPNGILTINRRSGKFNKLDMGYHDLDITAALPLNDKLIFGTKSGGMFMATADLKSVQKIYSLVYALSREQITDLEKFDDEIIVSTNGSGIFRLDEDLNLISGKDATYPENIYRIHLNDQNLLWMVAKEGLYLQNFSSFAIQKFRNDPAVYSSLADDFVTASETDSQGNVWFGTGKGLSIWNPETDRWRHIKNLNYTRHMNKPDDITDIVATGDHLWVATADDGVYKINIHTLLRAHYSVDALYKTEIQSASSLFVDAKANVWIGGEEAYLNMIKPNNEIKTYPIKGVKAIAELGPKKIIIATKSRVHSLDPYSGRITDLDELTANEELLYYSINDLKITREGLGLFATEGSGLLTYDFESEKLEILGEDSSLPSNNVTGIQGDLNEGLWLATDKGLAFYDAGNGSVKVFSELNGLSTNELTADITELKNGSLVIGSSKGINVFRPKTMLAQQEFKPELKLKKMSLPSEKDGKKANIDLAGREQVEIDETKGFKIEFAGISHLDPESILYSWKMEGLDEEWSNPSQVNTASYSNLAPGNYIFKVRAKLGDAAWSNPEELKVNVEAIGGTVSSVYLFMGVSVLAMVAIFVFVFLRRSKNADQLAKAELRDQLQKEFKKPVESAVQSLSKISASADAGNTEDLQRYAARFDELFNQILNFNYQQSVYEISKINIQNHLPQVIKDIEPVYKMKELEVIMNNQWGNSEFYYNMEMLDKIIFSLISGSAGYSFNKGKLIINLIQTSVGDLKLQITDNGRGIPEHDIKVLEKKKSLNPKTKFRDKGGLKYILKAQDLISKAGGSFSYETEKNEGSTFTAVLKNKKEDYRKVPERAAAIFKAEKTKPVQKTEFPVEITNFSESKILIIENDVETRNLLVNNIGKYCQIYQAGTAEEGIEKAGMIFPDIIISAMVLPDMNAFQLSKMLKRNIGLNHINIFLIAEEDQVLGNDQLEEMVEVLRKPIDINLLLAKITRILTWQMDLRNSYVRSHIEAVEVKFRNESDEKFITNLSDIVVQNIRNENFSVHDLSAALGITSNTLFMKLKSLVNLSPQDFMEFTRLNYARDLMEHTDMNVMEVAYKSGFSSPKLFYSSFKKFYGYSLTDAVEDKSI
ncbi:hybrid sensor histidine kinase/response regulator transcription factor [Christiangramia sediminis]|uniref:Helix-turn-helix domain-containing protein n=1 Tax=Christiangramia sediminis TaxID=2881336 RepID=A0A9X1LJP8_9FLAO|nr:triple tyrosine motif-containing protein [Christiangramia sediminis]MCB7481545.1 helix-turn-helix domain-containing protein [Christiangramia sediminis]